MPERQSVQGLLIDPNPEEIQLFREALADETAANRLHTVSDGSEALDFLNRRGAYADAPRPNLVLVDVDLPEMDGRELIETLTDGSALEGVPVIVLTGSADAEAVAAAYDRHANAYVQKPDDPDEFADVVRDFEDFWLDVVWLPPGSADRG